MSKNAELNNDVLNIIREKRIKRNVMAKTVVISKDNDMTIIMFTYGNGGREKEKR